MVPRFKFRTMNLTQTGVKLTKKRSDFRSSSWVFENTTDTAEVWKHEQFRECIFEGAHRGKKCTMGEFVERKTVEWFVWVTTPMSWYKARDHCASIGGQLFGNINGTDQQYSFLAEKQNHESFWLGISDADVPDVYRNLNGEIVSEYIRFVPNHQPKRKERDQYICGCIKHYPITPVGNNNYFHDAAGYNKLRFPCQIE